MTEPNRAEGGVTTRFASIALVIVAVVAAAGFFAGTRGAPAFFGYSPVVQRDGASHIPLATPQVAMEDAVYQQRIALRSAALAKMAAPRALEDRPRATDDEWALGLAARKMRRAYEGAPPTIPHPVDTHGAPACLVCHRRGASIGGRVAPAISHPEYQSCLQCHAPQGGFPFEPQSPPSIATSNSFEGAVSTRRGARAWPAAPPVMPHSSHMRDRCRSCHGPWAKDLRTSHPGRQNCVQCHAPSAELDQHLVRSTPMEGL